MLSRIPLCMHGLASSQFNRDQNYSSFFSTIVGGVLRIY